MRPLDGLTDKIIVFSSCLAYYLFQPVFSVEVQVVLAAVTIGGFLSYFENERFRFVLGIGYAVATLVWPDLIAFLPLIAYDMAGFSSHSLRFFLIVPFVRVFSLDFTPSLIAVGCMTLMSVLIRHRTEEKQRIHDRYSHVYDQSRETSIQLQRRNEELIRRQDDELNIATLNERNRIAREIHDNVGHLLSSAILQSGAMQTVNKDEETRALLKVLQQTLNQAMDSIRNSVHDLYDESVDLNVHIEQLISTFTFCEVLYEYRFVTNPDRKLKYALVAIVKEALTNVVKHSDATWVNITFREHPALYQLVIRDNGHVSQPFSSRGIGIQNMTDRINGFRGNINILTENGFEIFISIPKEES